MFFIKPMNENSCISSFLYPASTILVNNKADKALATNAVPNHIANKKKMFVIKCVNINPATIVAANVVVPIIFVLFEKYLPRVFSGTISPIQLFHNGFNNALQIPLSEAIASNRI